MPYTSEMNLQTKMGEIITIYDTNLTMEGKKWLNNASLAESNKLQKGIYGVLACPSSAITITVSMINPFS